MRILHTAATYRNDCHGVSGAIRDLVSSFSDSGHDAHVLAPAEAGTRRENGVMRVKMDPQGGVDARTLTRARGLKPDLIHVHDPVALSGPALTLARRLEVPVIYSMHRPRRSSSSSPDPRLYEHARTRLASICDLVVVPSSGARRWADMRVRRGELAEIPTGVTKDFLEARSGRDRERSHRELEDYMFVLGLTGGDRAGVGPDTDAFLAALAELMRQVPTLRLLVTGTRRFQKRVTTKLPGELLEKAVVTEETGTARKLRGWMDSLDLLVSPSTDEPEGRNAQRAMARGVAVLTPRTAPWAHWLADDETGFLVSRRDQAGFRAGLLRALRAIPAGGTGLADRLREAVASRTFDHTTSAYVEAYEALHEGSGRRRR